MTATPRETTRNTAALTVTAALIAVLCSCGAPDSMESETSERERFSGSSITDVQLFSKLRLNYPGLQAVKAKVAAGDYPGARRALADYYRRRPLGQPSGRRWFTLPTTAPAAVIRTADDALAHCFTIVNKRHCLGENINWESNPDSDVEWRRQFHRHEWMNALGRAYLATGQSKYALGWKRLLDSWLDSTSPKSPRLLDAGIRMRVWIAVWEYFVHRVSADIGDAIIIKMLKSIWQHADALKDIDEGGNHGHMEQYGVFTVAVMFPEFKDAASWLSRSAPRIERHVMSDFAPDGMHREMSTEYHNVGVYNSFRPLLLAAQNGLAPFTAAFRGRVEKALEYQMYVAKPNRISPALSDADPGKRKIAFLDDGAALFNRPDMLFVYSAGAKGTAPARSSVAFPDGGMYIMRGGWGNAQNYAQSLYLAHDIGRLGGLHGHDDCLSLEAYAFGRDLIVDPGRYTYDTSVVDGVDWRRYFKVGKAHNIVTVDGIDRITYRNETSWGADLQVNRKAWQVMPGYTFSHGWVSSANYDVDHDRKVTFIRNLYWIVTDLLTGPGTHTLVQHWHLPAQARGKVSLNPSTGAVVGNGLVLVPASPWKLTAAIDDDWVSTDYSKKTRAPTVRYRKANVGTPQVFETLLVPYRLGAESPPSVEASQLAVTRGNVNLTKSKASGLKIKIGAVTDLYLQAHDALAPTRYGNFLFDGEMAWLRRNSAGTVTNMQIRGGTRLEAVGGALLADTGSVRTAVSSRNHAVHLGNPDVRYFKIWCPSATLVKIAGVSVPFVQQGNYVIGVR
jgi:hypothetical protein